MINRRFSLTFASSLTLSLLVSECVADIAQLELEDDTICPSNFNEPIAIATSLLQRASVIQNSTQPNRPKGEFTTNAICRERNCINPVFPGLMDLEQLEASAWQCQHIQDVQQYMTFCRDVVEYNVAVPSPNASVSLEASIKAQEALAVTNYFYHLAGLNMEAWDHRPGNGELATPCASAVRAMVCHTYFPKAEAGCKKGKESSYLRPCRNVCSQYISACDVSCCDESTRCVFNNPSSIAKKGYADVDGPAATCTGTASLLEVARGGAWARAWELLGR